MTHYSTGNVGDYNELTETWKSYTERVRQFFLVNEVADDRKVPALLAIIVVGGGGGRGGNVQPFT